MSNKGVFQLNEEIAKERCLLGRSSLTCSFLVMADHGFACAKRSRLEARIRERRRLGAIKAMGDNCSGPPQFLLSIEREGHDEAN